MQEKRTRAINTKKLTELLELLNKNNVEYFNDGSIEIRLSPTGNRIDTTVMSVEDMNKLSKQEMEEIEFLHARDY